MATHAATLHRMIRLVETSDGPSDRELLRRFAGADDSAFTALVRRHTGLVYGVCRRALSNPQDAEDACQATFLVLAKKAKSERWQPSIANWLYTTARRVCRNARVVASRRAMREGRAAMREAVDPVDAMTGRELLRILDEELEKLPPRYREPLVLCCLGGLTRDEAAARLGVPAGTLKIRLERGRKRLAGALTVRGCELGAGLLAITVVTVAEASSPRLVDMISATIPDSPSAAVVALAKGAAANGIARHRWAVAAVFLIGAAALGIGLGRGTPMVAGPLPGQPPAAKPAPVDEPLMIVNGRVLGTDGKPRAGVALTLGGRDCAPVSAGKSGNDGGFTVRVPKNWAGDFLHLMAQADGAGVEFVNLLGIDVKKPIELRLSPDCPVHGRLIGTQGQPLAGVQVTVVNLAIYPKLDDYLAAWRKRHATGRVPWSRQMLSFRDTASSPFHARTDKDGRFTFRGLGAERLATLQATGGVARTDFAIVTRPQFDPKPFNEATIKKTPYADGRIGGNDPLLYGPEFAAVVEVEKPIRGTVVDEAGNPRPGVTVRLTDPQYRMAELTATTDTVGRFEIHGCKKMGTYVLSVPTDRTAGFLARTVTVSDTPGYEPVTAEVRVLRGVVVVARLLDSATGKPVSGQVGIHVLADNQFVGRGAKFEHTNEYAHYFTGVDGTVRLVSVPGRVLLDGKVTEEDFKYKMALTDPKYPQYFPKDTKEQGQVFTPDNTRTVMQGNHCKVLDLAADAKEVAVDIALEPASATTVAIRDADGKPLIGVWATGITSKVWNSPSLCRGDTCSVYGAETGKPRLVALFDSARKLAGTLVLTGTEKTPVVAKLGPGGTLKGRAVDEAGKPLNGAFVRLGFFAREVEVLYEHVNGRDGVEIDATGAFRIENVVPGQRFRVGGRHGQQWLVPAKKITADTVKPGETIDLGDVVMKPDVGE